MWQAEQDARCGGCGRLRTDAFDPDSPIDYEAIALRCRACEARDRASARFAKDGDLAGMYFALQDGQRPTM